MKNKMTFIMYVFPDIRLLVLVSIFSLLVFSIPISAEDAPDAFVQ